MTLPRRSLLSALSALALASLGLRRPGGALLAGCADEGAQAQDQGQVLAALVDVVALPSLDASVEAAGQLAASLAGLDPQPTLEGVEAARAAWSRARKAHLRTLAFGLGPGDDIAVTGGILDEPCDAQKLEALAAENPGLDRVKSAPASARGFFAVEALLFSGDASAASALASLADPGAGPGKRALLRALGEDLGDKIAAVSAGWRAGRFGDEIKNAGKGSATFRSQLEAFDALLNQALLAADRALRVARKGSGLVDLPAPSPDQSGQQLAEIDATLDGIDNLYTCRLGGASGPSISAVVASQSAPADASMRDKLAAARGAVAAFAPPLRGAAAARKAEVDGLIARLKAPHDALQGEVFAVLNVTVNISEDDGD